MVDRQIIAYRITPGPSQEMFIVHKLAKWYLNTTERYFRHQGLWSKILGGTQCECDSGKCSQSTQL